MDAGSIAALVGGALPLIEAKSANVLEQRRWINVLRMAPLLVDVLKERRERQTTALLRCNASIDYPRADLRSIWPADRPRIRAGACSGVDGN